MASAIPTATFTRPTDTTAYTSGDLVANSVTNTAVVALSWLVTATPHGPVSVRRAKVSKSTNTTTNASFRLHLYATVPTVTNGDNGSWLSTESGYLGSLDVVADKAFSDPAANGIGVPMSGTGTDVTINGGQDVTIYGLLEARGAYSPGNAEIFTISLEVYSLYSR